MKKKNKYIGVVLIVCGVVLALSLFTKERSYSNFYLALFFIGLGSYTMNKKV